ncbi:winged helix-turn-helix transcriptional regulator [Plectonema cf. radiosum LEGE 06105]|uniref:Winged helix-turn-helix transcriptional regulator n=1 Tax=Plectonema cf. radiosum LEGE 06105 TaxID=945769 RepID=A0A8J7F4Y8_9CYAN|nr:winged helix-turn-helix transcriptional regulator [Plectonema radiosum]MBE9215220.1 winged helix-turn-helix transcriptional regulator [Plectonema cf. radiosum LEGE 06105]
MKKLKVHTAQPSCNPLAKLFEQLSGQWTLYILCVLDTDGSLRFGELRSKVEGISTKVLTERLRMLEAAGIIHRYHEPTIPPKVTYSLTNHGKELSESMEHLCELASRWYGDEKEMAD